VLLSYDEAVKLNECETWPSEEVAAAIAGSVSPPKVEPVPEMTAPVAAGARDALIAAESVAAQRGIAAGRLEAGGRQSAQKAGVQMGHLRGRSHLQGPRAGRRRRDKLSRRAQAAVHRLTRRESVCSRQLRPLVVSMFSVTVPVVPPPVRSVPAVTPVMAPVPGNVCPAAKLITPLLAIFSPVSAGALLPDP